MTTKRNIVVLLILFISITPLSTIAMLSKEQSTKAEKIYTQQELAKQKKQTDLLFEECKKKNPNTNKIVNFIEQGADVNFIGQWGATALFYACAKNNEALAKTLLLHGAQVNIPAEDGNTPLHIASEEGYINIVKLLVKYGAHINSINNNKETPLHRACEFGHLDVVNFLIKNKADVNAINTIFVTPLHLACDGGFLDIAKILLKNGANVHAPTFSLGLTAMHLACKHDNIDIVKILLENGADINAKTIQGYTPLIFAVANTKIKMCEFLLQANADPYRETKDGATALDIAYEQNNKAIINLFKQYGIATISEQEAEKNMHAFFAELNEENLQKKQLREKKTKKNNEKKIATTTKKEPLSQKETEKPEQEAQTSVVSSSETTGSGSTTELMSNQPEPVIATTAVVASSPVMRSIKSTSAKQQSITPSPSIQSSSVIKEEPAVNQNNQYQVLQDAKLKWPRSLNPQQQDAVKEHLKQLKKWPHHGLDVKKLAGQSTMYRLRVGGHRITFSVDEANRTIKIHSIGLRKNIYKQLKI